MSYEAMPCVLKNEDGTPMYGLLIKPLQSQLVIQVAPNGQQQQAGSSSLCTQSSAGPSVQLVTVPSQPVIAPNWSTNKPTDANAGQTKRQRSHYPTILPRETGKPTSKTYSPANWSTMANGNCLSVHGVHTDNFAGFVQYGSPNAANSVKFSYTAALPQASSLAAPLAPSFISAGNQTASTFTQATLSQGFASLPSAPNGAQDSSAEQRFTNRFENSTGGLAGQCFSNSVISASNDSASCSTNNNTGDHIQNNGTDLDSLLRDIDLNEITNSLMPLLQDCSVENGDIIDEGGFSGRVINSTTVSPTDKNSDCSGDGSVHCANIQSHEMTSDSSHALAENSSTTMSRPPCRYQGLLANTNLRVGYVSGSSIAGTYSGYEHGVVSTSTDGGDNRAYINNEVIRQSEQVQAGSVDYDHQSHEATTPDSGIQSIGDSPHTGLQNSPMQFFVSSPDTRRRRISSPRSQMSSGSCSSTLPHRTELQQSEYQQVSPSLESPQPSKDSNRRLMHEEHSPSTTTWDSKYSQPLRVDTACFESISECETSPVLRPSANCTGGPQFGSPNTPRCSSFSDVNSDSGKIPYHRRTTEPMHTRKKRKRKRAPDTAGTDDGDEFNDMPVLQPEGLSLGGCSSGKCVDDLKTKKQSMDDPSYNRQSEESEIKQHQNDNAESSQGGHASNALLEKILAVVPKDQLASLRRILDERLNESTSDETGQRKCDLATDRTIDLGCSSTAAEKVALSRWQTTNAGYASDTSDVSSIVESTPWKRNVPENNSRRLSASSSGAVAVDGKKEDALKKLLDYRKKARMRCIKPPEQLKAPEKPSATTSEIKIAERIKSTPQPLELIPGVVRLCIGNEERTSNSNSLLESTKRLVEKIRNISDAPNLTRELSDVESGSRVAFNNLQNLEAEASDDEDSSGGSKHLSPCPQLTAEVSAQSTNSFFIEESSTPEKKKLIEVKENEKKNISMKIKLSLLRNTSEKKTGQHLSKLNKKFTETTAVINKAKRSRVNSILPLKKRFKHRDQDNIEIEEEHQALETESIKKRRRDERLSLISPGNKKRKLNSSLPDESLQQSSDHRSPTLRTSPNHSPVKNNRLIGLGAFRCTACKTWIRVEANKDQRSKERICSDCRSKIKNETVSTVTSQTSPRSAFKLAPDKSSETRKHILPLLETKTMNIGSKLSKKREIKSNDFELPAKIIIRTTKETPIMEWKYPRKSFVKAGVLHRNNGSSDSLSPVPFSWSLSDCKLFNSEMEQQDFQLPYDIWWHRCYKKEFTCVNPSENYRKLRSNVFVDGKQANGSQEPICNCVPPTDASADCCGDQCLNRVMFTECCLSTCPCGDRCTNARIQKRSWASGLVTFNSGTPKGVGVRTTKLIKEGAFICEYLGEIVSTKTFDERMKTWYKTCNHHYALNLDAGTVIDGYRAGSIARFINHSCEPNCEVQKWLVNGQYRMGIFALRNIKSGEELTYNYKFHAFNTPQACLCATPSCRGFVDSGNGNHQARKSKPQRSNGNEEVSCAANAYKINVLKPLSYREKLLVVRKRLFLFRNLDRVQKAKLQAAGMDSSGVGSSNGDEKNKPGMPFKRNSRYIRMRQYIASETTSELTHRLQSLFDILSNAQDTDGIPLFPRGKRSNSTSRSNKKSISINNNHPVIGDSEILMELVVIESNIEQGHYTTLDTFDKDVKILFAQTKATGELSNEKLNLLTALERQYETEQLRIAETLRGPVNGQLSTSTESSEKRLSTIGKSDRKSLGNGEFWDEIYWGTKAPFIVSDSAGEELPMTLWSQKGDSFDKDDDKVHCICGICEDEGTMIQCDACQYWHHSDCIGIAGDQSDTEFICDFCKSGNLAFSKDVVLCPQPEIVFPQCTYYRALMKDGLQIRVGETVYVKRIIDETHKQLLRTFNRECVQQANGSSTPMDVTDLDTVNSNNQSDDGSNSLLNNRSAYYRSELRVFQVDRLFIGPRGVKFVFGSYRSRPHETYFEPSRRFYRNEVFVTPLYDTLPLDAIVGRCLVLDPQTYCKGRPKYPKYAEEDIYICEHRVDKGQRLVGKTNVRNQFAVCMKPYIFEMFPEKLRIKRDFMPFDKSILASKSEILKKKKRVAEIIEKLRQSEWA